MPIAQVRDVTMQKRENDVVMGTFGRGFYVLDDYSALREITAADAGRRSTPVPAASRVRFIPGRWSGACGCRRCGEPVRQLHDAESAGWRVDHVQRAPDVSRRYEARADDHRQPTVIRCVVVSSTNRQGLRRFVWNLIGDAPAAAAAPQRGGGGGGGGRGAQVVAVVVALHRPHRQPRRRPRRHYSRVSPLPVVQVLHQQVVAAVVGWSRWRRWYARAAGLLSRVDREGRGHCGHTDRTVAKLLGAASTGAAAEIGF